MYRADPSHLDALADLFDAYRRFYGQPADVPGARAFLAERLARNESAVFVATPSHAMPRHVRPSPSSRAHAQPHSP